ncbi:hypothetical protein AeNC1_004052 [Aphanomyces euteiches]|nr:hypothetical protein AeNC1_004052 [Aphanomyces euteiches]
MEATELPLPQDILIKIVFFVEEWTTVTEVLKALRPTKVLGPLEHLWLQLQWSEWDLWPRLDLSRIDAASRKHLEGIAKYYSQIFVDYKTDMAWFR